MTRRPSWVARAQKLPRAVIEALPPRLSGLFRHGRAPGLRTAKTVLAAVLAFVIADWLHTSHSPILAPLTALLVVQLTMYETLAHGRERIVSVVAGVLVAVLFANVTGLTWWSLGLVVAVSLVAGRLLRLGPHLLEVPISAMLVLAVGGAEHAALGRVVETLIGAVVGVMVNLAIAPPLYVQPASDAIADLARRMASFSTSLAEGLRGDWSREAADRYLTGARALGEEVARADRRLARTEESARLNPRGRIAREAQPRLRSTLSALEHAQVGLRNLARALLDRTYFVPDEAAAFSPEARAALADVLDAFAVSLGDAVTVVSGAGTADSSDGRMAANAADLEGRRHRLSDRLMVDPRADPSAWAQHGALLSAVDRLRVEVETATHPSDVPWRPQPLTERQRAAVRQALVAGGRRPSRAATVSGRRAQEVAARLARRRLR
ncbi:MAG: FUSC family protein [Blastococcus sp.]